MDDKSIGIKYSYQIGLGNGRDANRLPIAGIPRAWHANRAAGTLTAVRHNR